MENYRGEDGLQTGGLTDELAVGLSYIEIEGGQPKMPHRRTHIVLLAGVLVLANAAAPTQAKESKSARISSLKEGIKFYRQATWRWQDTAFVRRTPTAYHERWTKGSGYLQWLAKLRNKGKGKG